MGCDCSVLLHGYSVECSQINWHLVSNLRTSSILNILLYGHGSFLLNNMSLIK